MLEVPGLEPAPNRDRGVGERGEPAGCPPVEPDAAAESREPRALTGSSGELVQPLRHIKRLQTAADLESAVGRRQRAAEFDPLENLARSAAPHDDGTAGPRAWGRTCASARSTTPFLRVSLMTQRHSPSRPLKTSRLSPVFSRITWVK